MEHSTRRRARRCAVTAICLLLTMAFVVAAPVAGAATAAAQSDGVLYWGWWSYNDGAGNPAQRSPVPLQLPDLTAVTAISVRAGALGSPTVTSLKSDGTVWRWGDVDLGDGSPVDTRSSVSVQVSGLTNITAVAGHFALRADGTVWSWGHNLYGVLGDGTTIDRTTPVQVSGLTGVIAIGGDEARGYAAKSDGSVWSWGEGSMPGTGSGGSTPVPTLVPGLTNVTAFSVKDYYENGGGVKTVLALRSDGTVWSWGDNRYGGLGIPSAGITDVPAQIPGLAHVTAIANARTGGYALLADGTVMGWGSSSLGQTGSNSPQPVKGISDVISIAGGIASFYAVRSDHTVWALGDNRYGQLGNGTF